MSDGPILPPLPQIPGLEPGSLLQMEADFMQRFREQMDAVQAKQRAARNFGRCPCCVVIG